MEKRTIGKIVMILGIAALPIGAIFVVKGAQNLTGQGGVELDLLLLASLLVVIVIGPGRISISHALKKVPRFLQ